MSEVATYASVASKFMFLYEIASVPEGTKVRFLGCVVDYDIGKGRLLLEHAYPKQTLSTPRVFVDVNLVLESTHSSALSPGSWINVVGYTQNAALKSRKREQQMRPWEDESGLVQAILIWNAGALRLDDYETTIEEQRSVQQQHHSSIK